MRQEKNKLKLTAELIIEVGAIMVLSLLSVSGIITTGVLLFPSYETIITSLGSQLAILIMGLMLINFDKKYILAQLKNKLSFKLLLQVIGLIFVLFLANIGFSRIIGPMESETTNMLVNSNNILLTFFIPVVVAPLFEEFAFRLGLKKKIVSDKGFSNITFLIMSSVLFGLLHWQPGEFGLPIVIFVGVIGLIKGITYLKTNNILVTILGHAAYNGIIMFLATLV